MITDLISDRFQADRMYQPTPFRSTTWRLLVDDSLGVHGRYSSGSSSAALPPGAQVRGGPSGSGPNIREVAADRAMDPWTVVREWLAGPSPRLIEECQYRDYWRTVVARTLESGQIERLFLDPKSGFPVKLERLEPHDLFGDVRTEYLWTTWVRAGDASLPRSVFRMQDGVLDRAWTQTAAALVPRDSFVVPLARAAAAGPAQVTRPPEWGVVDTVRVSSTTWLLKSPIYSNLVTLQRDTIFILDAQQDEARARADSGWIGKLFPGRHPIVLVVTDLAWPHIAGMRYWVALGVPVVTHRISGQFLREVIERRWTLEPDLLEQRRATLSPSIRSIDGTLRLAGGDVTVHPIDGIASEGALMVYLPREQLLYAGDYIQPGSLGAPRPGFTRLTYLDEVVAAARRDRLAPERFAAMHMPLTPWATALAGSTR